MSRGSFTVSKSQWYVKLKVVVVSFHNETNLGIHAAAKETVALAEQRFLTNQHEWQFDNAWQEMLNHATMKVNM